MNIMFNKQMIFGKYFKSTITKVTVGKTELSLFSLVLCFRYVHRHQSLLNDQNTLERIISFNLFNFHCEYLADFCIEFLSPGFSIVPDTFVLAQFHRSICIHHNRLPILYRKWHSQDPLLIVQFLP